MTLIKRTRYFTDDPECDADYAAVEVWLEDEGQMTRVREYGDYYHDKGDEKADGFIDGAYWGASEHGGSYEIGDEERVADYEC